MLQKWFWKVQGRFQRLVSNERGVVALEWIMVAILAVTIVTLILNAVQADGDESIAQKIIKKITDMIDGMQTPTPGNP